MSPISADSFFDSDTMGYSFSQNAAREDFQIGFRQNIQNWEAGIWHLWRGKATGKKASVIQTTGDRKAVGNCKSLDWTSKGYLDGLGTGI